MRLRPVHGLPLLLCLSPVALAQTRAQPDFAITVEGQPVLVDVLANDTAPGEAPVLRLVTPARHGTTRIENGQIRYAPRARFHGKDSFYYFTQARGRAQVGLVTVTVTRAANGVTLIGQVVDDPIPHADVSVSIGNTTFVTTADEQGIYTLRVAAADPAQMVTLRASGTSPSDAPVDFASVVGSVGRLTEQAGADGILSPEENGQTDITHISSAQYVLLQAANGGEPVADQAELRQLLQNIDLNEMARLAAAIQLVVDGGEPLPAGTTSVLEMIASEAAMEAFVAGLDPGQLEAATAAVTADPTVTPVFQAGFLPPSYALLVPSAPGTIRVGVSGTGYLELDGADTGAVTGSGRYLTNDLRGNTGITWALVDGRIQVELAVPSEGLSYPFNACGRQDRATIRTTGMTLSRVADGDGVDAIDLTMRTTSTVEDLHPDDGCDTGGVFNQDGTGRWLAYEEGVGELPYASGDTGPTGPQRILPITDASADAGWRVIAARTEAAGAGRLSYQDNAGTQYELRRHQTDGRKGEGVLAIARTADGREASFFAMSGVVESIDWRAADAIPLGRLRSGFDISQFQPTAEEDFGFFLLNSSGAWDGTGNYYTSTGIYESVSYASGAPQVLNYAPYTWVWTGPEVFPQLVARSYRRNTAPRETASCTIGIDGCYLSRERRWSVIARDAERYYVMEHLRIFAPDGALLTNSSRSNFYDTTE